MGRPLPGTSVRLSDDGEILIKGIGLFRGYRNNPQATAEALDNGWLRSGDLGSFDSGGFLRITGRRRS